MRDLNELNLNEGGEPVSLPAPTPGQLRSVEELVGRRMPSAYIDFLMFANGGSPEVDTFYVEIDGNREDWNVNHFFRISTDPNRPDDVIWNYRHLQASAPRQILPIADNGGGDLICLDLTEESNSRVLLWIHDKPEDRLHLVANSFEEFVDSLTTNPDYI